MLKLNLLHFKSTTNVLDIRTYIGPKPSLSIRNFVLIFTSFSPHRDFVIRDCVVKKKSDNKVVAALIILDILSRFI